LLIKKAFLLIGAKLLQKNLLIKKVNVACPKPLCQIQSNTFSFALEALGVETGSYSGTQPVVLDDVIATRGYGQTHDLGKGWTYRVDKPSSDNAKPYVHVDNNKKIFMV